MSDEQNKARAIEEEVKRVAKEEAKIAAKEMFQQEMARLKAEEDVKTKDAEYESLKAQLEEHKLALAAKDKELIDAKLKPGFDEGSDGEAKNDKPGSKDNDDDPKELSPKEIMDKLKNTPAFTEENGWSNLGLRK